MTMPWVAALLVPALVCAAVIALLRRSSLAARLGDVPNERSLHSVPTPRLGGLGVMAGALPAAIAFGDDGIRVIAASALFLVIVSFLDDLRSLPIAVRLPAHFVAAAAALLAIASPVGTNAGLGVVEGGFALLAIVWMTNLYNFMDGSDGLAGGMAVAGFAALSFAAWQAHVPGLALACAAVASASAAFLAFNFPPARVFLGDAGSIPLGFLAAALGMDGVMLGAWAAWLPILVFSPFIADATLTIVRRGLRGEAIWKAHRTHAYQRLVVAGWSRRKLVFASYALIAAAALSALVALFAETPVRFGIIYGWAAAYVLIFIAIERRTRAA